MNHRQWVAKSNSPLLSNRRKKTHLHIDDKNCRVWFLHFETIFSVILSKLILKCLVLETTLSCSMCSLLTNVLPHHTVFIVLIYQKCEHWWITDLMIYMEESLEGWSGLLFLYSSLGFHYSWYLLPIILYFIYVLP